MDSPSETRRPTPKEQFAHDLGLAMGAEVAAHHAALETDRLIRAAVAAEREACAVVLEARAKRLESKAQPYVNDWPDDTLMAKADALRGGAALLRARGS